MQHSIRCDVKRKITKKGDRQIKKKVISLVLAMSMVFGLAACNNAPATEAENQADRSDDERKEEDSAGVESNVENAFDSEAVQKAVSEIMTVTIEGNQYDFSGDYLEIVAQLAKDGLCGQNAMRILQAYDENGELVQLDMEELSDKKVISTYERPLSFKWSPVVRRNFILYDLENFSTVDAIGYKSTAEELKNLEGYTVYGPDEYLAAVALYVDGNLVDLEEYRDEYETWLQDVEELGAEAAYTLHLSYATYYINNSSNDRTQLGDDTTLKQVMQRDAFETNMLLIFAGMDAGQALENGEITCYSLISYRHEEEVGVAVTYQYYYADEEMAKFDDDKKELRDGNIERAIEEIRNQ
ncbi:MAG: hypothetical protein IJ405_07585 [Lachnospiraceae bacterium]|nr:hypothetical protein [Lachnospiraceae bacterium]